MYFFDLPGFHPINGIDTDNHGKYPYLHFKNTIFERDETNYIDSYFPFQNIAIGEGKSMFVSEKNLIAVFDYDPVFRDDLFFDHVRAVSKEQLNIVKEGFYKGYLAGILDFPRQIQFAINLVDSPLKEIKLRNFIEFCGDHLFFEGFATPNCLYALGFIQAYLLKAFGEYRNLIQSLENSIPKEKFEENIKEEVTLAGGVQEDEKSEVVLVEQDTPKEAAPAEAIEEDGISRVLIVEENIPREVVPDEFIQEVEIFKTDLVEENVPNDIGPAGAFEEDEKPVQEPIKENILKEVPFLEATEEVETCETNIVEEEILEGVIYDMAAQLTTENVESKRFEKIPLDYPTDEIISLWMILLEVWKCKPVNSIQVFFEPKEVLDLLGSMFDDSVNKRMLPKSEHKFFSLPPGKYDRIINLLMHATYKFNTDRNNINLEKYCEVLIETFSCYKKTKVASLKSNINKERGNIINSIRSLPDSKNKYNFLKVLGKINEYRT